MFPVLFRLGPLTIHSYGLMMAIGVALALWFLYRQSKKQGLDSTRVLDAGVYTILVSLVGAKVVLLVSNFSYYTQYPGELLSLARSGGVFQGGLVFGVLFALWYFRRKNLPTWRVADIAAPSLALGHGFGRIGCFMAGCCYGRACETTWGVEFTSSYAHNLTGVPLNETLHPVQLYESALNFLNFFLLYFGLRKKKFEGQVFSLYIINYSLIRYFTEFYRGDHPDRAFLIRASSPYLSFTWPQFFCVLGVIFGFLLMAIFSRKKGG